ncbi:hypothetical protein ABZP36_034467, partial [Zizania latifolia]
MEDARNHCLSLLHIFPLLSFPKRQILAHLASPPRFTPFPCSHATDLASHALAAHADIDGEIEEAERKEEEWDHFYEAKRKDETKRKEME